MILKANIETNFFIIRIYDRIYHVDHLHSWDERVAKSYIEIAEKLISKHLSREPWALLIDLREWELSTPAAENILKNHFSKGMQAGLSCIATIIESSEIKKWQANRIAMEKIATINAPVVLST